MSKRRRLRRPLAILLLLVIVLAAAWTGLWYIVSGRLEDHLAAWEQQQRAAGWTITHDAPRRSGWPMAAGITLPNLAISGGRAYLPGGVAWQAASLTLAIDIRHPNDLFLGVTGRQSLSLAGGPALPFRTTKLIGRIALAPGDQPGLMQFHATGLLAAVPVAGHSPAPLSIADIAAAMRADAQAGAQNDAVILAATLTGLDLPPRFVPALAKPQSLSFDVALSGPLPSSTADLLAGVTAWRDAGGSLTLRQLHLADAPLTLDAEGRLQLDQALRPAGNLTLQAQGFDPALDRLAAGGTLSRAELTAIKAVLGLMMRPEKPGQLTLPLRLHDGLVSLGAIPLLRLTL